MQAITDVTRDRIIGWLKKGLLTEDEERFCLRVYPEDELGTESWHRLRKINRRLKGEMR